MTPVSEKDQEYDTRARLVIPQRAAVPKTRTAKASGERDERYTLDSTIEWAKQLLGIDGFDLDVAACDESHKAPRWYDVAANGLDQPWSGRVWCNPPYSSIGDWVTRAWAAVYFDDVDLIAMFLPCNRTEQPWWQLGVEQDRDGHSSRARMAGFAFTTHYPPGRTKFGSPGNAEAVGVGSPPFACVLLVWRRLPKEQIPMTVWNEIDAMRAKYEAELMDAKETAKACGFKGVKCSDVGLTWSAQSNPAAKFDSIKGRPNTIGPFKTAAELVEAMRAFMVIRPEGVDGTKLTPEDHAKAAAFLDAKR